MIRKFLGIAAVALSVGVCAAFAQDDGGEYQESEAVSAPVVD